MSHILDAAQRAPLEFNAGTSGAALTIDWMNGSQQIGTLTADCAFTFINAVPGMVYRLILREDRVGGWVPTFPASVKWPNDTPPRWITEAHNVIVVALVFTSLDGGAYFGCDLGNALAVS
jgi:hypothetical protein